MATEHQDQAAGLPCPQSSGSFWHCEPSPFLLGHRTTPELPSDADIVIIGSGITGASAARYLADDERSRGLKVVILEAREACWGATGRNGGHCQPLLFERGPDVGAFEIKNVAAVKDYITKNEVDCDWRDVTACHAFWDRDLVKAAMEELKAIQARSPELGKLIEIISDAKSLAKHRVHSSAAGAALTQGAASLWPYKYVTFVLEKLVRDGCINLQTNTPVTKCQSDASDGMHTLTTPRGTIKATNVIFATNGYTSHLLREFSSLIVPIRCEMSALHPPAGSERLPNSYGFLGGSDMAGTDDYLIQRPFHEGPDGVRRGGQLMYGGGRLFARYPYLGQTDDDVVDIGEATYLRGALLKLLDLGGDVKDLTELRASHEWTGIKGYSRDHMPWVGKSREGLYISAGYTGHGMPNATLCGKAVVEMILGERQGLSYEDSCRKLVEAGDLPVSYILTAERLKSAMKLPTVAEQDAQEMSRYGNLNNGGVDEQPGAQKCVLM